MKKILTISLLFLMIISINVIANADMEAPMVKVYVAKVKEINGVDFKDYAGKIIVHLDYGDEVEVYHEYFDSNTDEIYAGCRYTVKDGEPYINNRKSVSGEVPLKSLSVNENEYISESLNLEKTIIGYVYDRDGIEIYKGPSEIYDKTGIVIPYGTKLTLYKEKDEYQDIIPWFYVEYNGVTGWINETFGRTVYESDLDYVVALPNAEFKVYNEETKEFELETIIPGNTILLNPLKFDPWSKAYLVTYNGIIGKISDSDVAYEHQQNMEIITKKEKKIYSLPDLNEGEVLGTIPESIVLVYKFDGNYINWRYIEYNGVKGWIDGKDTSYLSTSTRNDGATFDTSLGQENIAFIESKDNDVNTIKEKDKAYLNEDTETNVKVIPSQIIFAGVVAAVIISLTCIVSIVLINKTSNVENNNNDNNNENEKKDNENK